MCPSPIVRVSDTPANVANLSGAGDLDSDGVPEAASGRRRFGGGYVSDPTLRAAVGPSRACCETYFATLTIDKQHLQLSPASLHGANPTEDIAYFAVACDGPERSHRAGPGPVADSRLRTPLRLPCGPRRPQSRVTAMCFSPGPMRFKN